MGEPVDSVRGGFSFFVTKKIRIKRETPGVNRKVPLQRDVEFL